MAYHSKQRKGLVTISVLLLSTTLLLLASFLSSYSSSLRFVNAESLPIMAASAQSEAASSAFKNLVASELGVFTVLPLANISNVTFESNSSDFGTFREKSLRLQSFLEGRSSPGNLTLNMTGIPDPPYLRPSIRPYAISIDFSQSNLSFLPATPSDGDRIISYSIQIKANKPGLGYDLSSANTVAQGSPNAIYLEVGAQGSDGTTGFSTYFDRTMTSIIPITSGDGTNATLISINESLLMGFGGPIWSRISIELNSSGVGEATYVELGENIINVQSVDGTSVRGKAIAASTP